MAEIGSIFGGRYRLVELLGQGGMATVYRALDTQLGRDVTIKLLRPEYLRDPDFSSRFRQEAQNAASLSHPNVVTVYDYGEDPSGPFIVMEYVDGEDLATILKRNGSLPPTQAARIGAAVARALEAAHTRGIVHRDVKPGNVLIGRDGRVKVVDFGIARAIAEAQMTLPGTTLGSVHYFSPEQARGEPTTAASDIFSLGIVLFEMLTGRRPWEGDSAAAVALARLSPPVPDPVLLRPSLPSDLAAIDRKSLALDPADRFATAGAMADALERTIPPAVVAAGAAAAAGVAAVGVAGANPTVVAYPPDAYAGLDDDDDAAAKSAAAAAAIGPDPGSGPGASVWIAGIVAIALLAAIAFLVFQLLSGPGRTSTDVAVPDFVGRTLADATREADSLDLVLVSTPETSDQPVGTILAQDPPKGTLVAPTSEINVTVAAGIEQVPVPDLRNQTEAQAVALLIESGLVAGSKTRGLRRRRCGRPRRQPEPPARLDRGQGHRRRLRRLQGSRTDPDPHADADADPHADPDTDTDGSSDTDPDGGSHPDADGGSDPDTDRGSDADTGALAFRPAQPSRSPHRFQPASPGRAGRLVGGSATGLLAGGSARSPSGGLDAAGRPASPATSTKSRWPGRSSSATACVGSGAPTGASTGSVDRASQQARISSPASGVRRRSRPQ